MKLGLSQRDIARFWSRVGIAGPDDCWPWLAGRRKMETPYGGFKVEGRSLLAHRVAHFLHTGEWPPVVAHACDNPPCCNPDHLRSSTQVKNMAEAAARERMSQKLTGHDVRAILASNERDVDLARTYGIAPSQISQIRNGKSRRHLAATG